MERGKGAGSYLSSVLAMIENIKYIYIYIYIYICNTMYVHVLYNKIHLLKNLRMKQPVQVNPGLNCSFSYENCIYIYIYILQRLCLYYEAITLQYKTGATCGLLNRNGH